MGSTLLLDRSTWDLVLDINNNIAVATEPYALAQDAASSCKVFKGECYYDTTRGIPYIDVIFGKNVPLSLIKSYLANESLRISGIVTANAYISSLSDRDLGAQVQITDANGTALAVNI